jgi:prepilin-type N-terminal cleavage/methylation domain-containing protein
VTRLACPRFASRPHRGFTLVELLVVVTIIAIVAAVAIPSMTSGQFDRRVFTDAAGIGEIVREARTRAVGRGAAELLTLTSDGSLNKFTVRLDESVQANPSGGGSNVPVSSCGAPTIWTGAGASSTFVDQFSFTRADSSGKATLEGQAQILARMVYPFTTASTTWVADNTSIYLCFTPSGRVLFSTTAAPSSFGAMGGPLAVQLTRIGFGSTPLDATQSNLIRTVWIPPTGATRITSH